ncbi:hypothetical protein H9L09_13225 [Nocardioides mesophilus]|uniref:GP-PDE domain-containing protein n=1 Tax=Nocardioides mesophilus TaxID=433659 RepID=A0A7G9RHG5_9ACTN|nr:hypothetical protein H9L09_13225 [Nocardioides mesophilus]
MAHRGASAYAPENTLAALRKAIARDADLAEFDVQRTRDGAVVLLHDATLERTTDVRRVFPDRGPWRVGDFSYAEIARLDAGSWKGPEYAGERIPLLTEALEVLRPSGLGALVELKHPRLYPGLVAELATLLDEDRRGPAAPGSVIVQSFDESAARELKGRVPSVPVGVLGSPARDRLASIASWADLVNPHHHRADRSYVDEVRRHGLQCFVWTVDRPVAMRRAVRAGVDGVITNRPDVFRRFAAEAPAS